MFLYELQNFIKVAEILNITRAAQELGMTQSGLSKAIKTIETELGVELFSRQKKNLKLTTAGVTFFAEANNFLINCRHLQTTGSDSSAKSLVGTLSILYTNRAEQIIDFMDMFYRVNKVCREKYPGISIRLRRESGYVTNAHIMSNKVDVAFMLQSSALANDPGNLLEIHTIRHDIPLALAVSKDHPLSKAANVSIEDIKKEEFIMIQTRGQSEEQRALYALFNAYGYVPYVSHTATDYASLYMLVSSGYGVSIIPHDPSCRNYPNICYIPIRQGSDKHHSEAHTRYDLVMAYPKANSNPLLPIYVDLAGEILDKFYP